MRILGKWNWYFPTWLEWLPNVSIGEGNVEARPKAKGARKPRPVEQPAPVLALAKSTQ